MTKHEHLEYLDAVECCTDPNRPPKLFTAAPDLLAACKAEALMDRFAMSEPGPGCYTTEELERDMAAFGWNYETHGPVGFYSAILRKAAIAKATGATP